MAVMSISLFFLYFLCLWSLLLGVTIAEKLLCLLCKTILKVSYLIIILWISFKMGDCFDFNHSLGCVYPTLYTIRLLGRVYHFSLLICYPYSFYFHALMMVAFGSQNFFLSMILGKTRNLTWILTFSQARGFDSLLSLGVATLLVTPVMGISYPGRF